MVHFYLELFGSFPAVELERWPKIGTHSYLCLSFRFVEPDICQTSKIVYIYTSALQTEDMLWALGDIEVTAQYIQTRGIIHIYLIILAGKF